MTLPVVDPSVLVDAGNLTALQQQAAAHNPQALRQAAQQFESLFVGMVLKSMRQANFSDPLFGSDQGNLYQDMYDDQIAAEISKGRGLGLADMLVQQLRRTGLAGTSSSRTLDVSSIPASAQPRTAGPQGLTPGTAGGTAPTSNANGANGGASSSPAATATSGATPPASTTASTAVSSCPTAAQQLQFAQSLWPQAQQAAGELGVSPVSLLAQAALETDWGRSVPRTTGGATSNNLFGIKAGSGWNGASVPSGTQEYANGTATSVKAQFRAYATPGQCFEDYVNLLQSSPRYAAALGTGGNTQAFATALQQGGYATDPSYAAKLGAVAGTLTRALQGAAGGLSAATGILKSAASLPTTSGSNTL